MGWSPQCYIPSYVEFGPPVPEKNIFDWFLLGMSSGVRISERSNHVPKSEPNFSIRRFEKNNRIVQKCTISFRKYFRIITQRGNMTSSRTSDFADESTTIGDNCHKCVFVWVDLISKHQFLSYSHVLSIQ